MKNKSEVIEDKIYNKLKSTLLEVGYLNNNLIYAAKLLKEMNEKDYINKTEGIDKYLHQKMQEGDGVAYALLYAAHEKELSKNEKLKDFKMINKFLSSHTDLHPVGDNEFFDPKVVYFAEVLGGDSEGY